MDANLAHNIKINTDAVKRLIKEKRDYEEEAATAAQNLQNSQFDHNSYEYKQLIELDNEARKVSSYMEKKLKTFVDKLQQSLNAANGYQDQPEYIEAMNVLKEL
ncbi:hypothetical protein TVAG_488940 [Trichomonas vaginalis G3]|uniref:Tubulin-specific chaperone A n=1 Tax=Trichomonas vaginalis (strain ATCC PRA-98 / G3) TaxID=412133 RepID=A2FL66_TRIV3|nr:post-chaperonin tubulin folding pathway [Trichomonas vaginalis G3]EAX94355.1 hypothetical protein TVAG_488940 [Trichomonas vaginalis G3]KAI5536482.1 post-chaperonin tubulin folding pathway [Trichomonas vaginalis G3]|eukprot:XP_001307285.1 hypothetical protein [Trichomonas vaginalis G3]